MKVHMLVVNFNVTYISHRPRNTNKKLYQPHRKTSGNNHQPQHPEHNDSFDPGLSSSSLGQNTQHDESVEPAASASSLGHNTQSQETLDLDGLHPKVNDADGECDVMVEMTRSDVQAALTLADYQDEEANDIQRRLDRDDWQD